MRRDLAPTLALLLTFAQAPAQTPTPQTPQTATPQQPQPAQTPTPEDESDDTDVVRITSNLVQVDAVVTDKKGRQVTDLKAEEFEILADGKPQQITNFLMAFRA